MAIPPGCRSADSAEIATNIKGLEITHYEANRSLFGHDLQPDESRCASDFG